MGGVTLKKKSGGQPRNQNAKRHGGHSKKYRIWGDDDLHNDTWVMNPQLRGIAIQMYWQWVSSDCFNDYSLEQAIFYLESIDPEKVREYWKKHN